MKTRNLVWGCCRTLVTSGSFVAALLRMTCIALAADHPSSPIPWQRDPFNLPELSDRGLTSTRTRIPCPTYLKLEGIMGGGKAPQAFINGDIFGLGQSVKGYTISHISENNVTLQTKKFVCSLTRQPSGS